MIKQRMCCVCRGRKNVEELIRVAKINGQFVIDQIGNANGRGCYLCPSCVGKAIKTRALNRSFKTNINNEIYQALAIMAEQVYNIKEN